MVITNLDPIDESIILDTAFAGKLVPPFGEDTPAYTVEVPNETFSLALTAATESAGATLTLNTVALVSGNASDPIDLVVGDNVLTVEVIAAGGTKPNVYTLMVKRSDISTPVAQRIIQAEPSR